MTITPEELTPEAVRQIVREEFERAASHVLEEAKALRPLLSIEDVARTLNVSKRTVETRISAGELPSPLWVGGVRRWHPDAIAAFLRSDAVRGGR